jgi:Domain of unknown function (DUF4216)
MTTMKYEVLKEVVGLSYNGVDNKVLFFNSHWFDITNSVKIDHEHDLAEVKHTLTFRTNESFILTCQVTQVYIINLWNIKKKYRENMKKGEKEKRGGAKNSRWYNPNKIYIMSKDSVYWYNLSITPMVLWLHRIIQSHYESRILND